jgi:hypothetical protein
MEKRAQKEEEEEEAKKDAEGRTYAVPLAKTLSKVTGTPQGNTSSESSAYAVVGRGQTVVSFHKKKFQEARGRPRKTILRLPPAAGGTPQTPTD